VERVHEEIRWARQRADEKTNQVGRMGLGTGRGILTPSGQDYVDYRDELEAWRRELEALLAIDFVLTNMGRVPAEDVEVTLSIPAELQPSTELPLQPQAPPAMFAATWNNPQLPLSKHTHPDVLVGPELYPADASGVIQATWEVGKLYHGRPLFAHVEADDVSGLLISASCYKQLLSRAGEEIQLRYVVHAANVPEALSGVLILR
jgi:hypothetical protein